MKQYVHICHCYHQLYMYIRFDVISNLSLRPVSNEISYMQFTITDVDVDSVIKAEDVNHCSSLAKPLMIMDYYGGQIYLRSAN